MNRILSILIFVFLLLTGCRRDDPTPVPTVTATPEPLQSTLTALPPLTPAVTPEPLPHWTILLYMDADNNLEPFALADWEEIAAAQFSADVQVVAQLDRSDRVSDVAEDWQVKRFVKSSEDWQEISALGELNMSSAETLTDFVAWGTETYPAQNVALIVWGHGAGWRGTGSDLSAEGAQLSLVQLQRGVQDGLLAGEVEQLALIGFDACLMGQHDVFAAVGDSAEIGIASSGLVPGDGWNYTTWLDQLASAPESSADDLARMVVDAFAEQYRESWTTKIAAVDLALYSFVTDSLGVVGELAATDMPRYANDVSDALAGSRLAGIGQENEVIDLGRFGMLLSQLTNAELQTAAATLGSAIEQAVIARYPSQFASGVGLYFPSRAGQFAAGYQSADATTDTMLATFYDLVIPAPDLTLNSVPIGTINAQNPAYIGFEMTGRQIDEVTILAGRVLDGERQLIDYQPLLPEATQLPDGTRLATWRSGIHRDFYVWNTESTYLTDGEQGMFVVMWPVAGRTNQFALQGRYVSPEGDELPASILFEHGNGERVGMWGGERGAIAEIVPAAGATFRPIRYTLNAENQIIGIEAEPFALDTLTYEWRPVPDGDYFLGLSAESISGERSTTFTDLTLDSTTTATDTLAYLDPYVGYQFPYPADWVPPTNGDFGATLLYTNDVSGTLSFQVKLYVQGVLTEELSAETVRNSVLDQWVGVSELFTETVTVADQPALRTAYGYLTDEGQRTGTLLTFVHDNVGYAVDLDMPTEQEAEMIALMDNLVDGWAFRETGFGSESIQFATLGDTPTYLLPKNFRYELLDNGWKRILQDAQPQTFLAVREDKRVRVSSADLNAAWLNTATSGVQDGNIELTQAVALAGYSWLRTDFTYTAVNGVSMRGAILTSFDNAERVIWVESPVESWDGFEGVALAVSSAEFE